MPPFIEIGGEVYAVLDWDYDMVLPDRLVLRRLMPDERERFERLRRESDIELVTNWTARG